MVILADGEPTSFAQWDAAYRDFPNRLRVVRVKDRSSFKTTDVDRRLAQPAGLQAELDALIAKFPQGRSFVRYVASLQRRQREMDARIVSLVET